MAAPAITFTGSGATTRRGIIEALIGLGAAGALHGALDRTAWRAYEAVEEAWIRERHFLLIRQSPAVSDVAEIDLELKLAELARRGLQFRHLLKQNPQDLRIGVVQLSWLPFTDRQKLELQARDFKYRKQEQRISSLMEALRSHPNYPQFRQAQMHLWRTPEYRDIHRRYASRMQELNTLYP